jgi:hypothetical protein
MLDDAVAELKKAAQLSGDSPTVIADLARAYAASGKRRETIKLLGDLKKRSNSVYRVVRRSPWSMQLSVIRIKPWTGYKKVTKSALTLGFSCSRASILSVQICFKDLVRRIGLPRCTRKFDYEKEGEEPLTEHCSATTRTHCSSWASVHPLIDNKLAFHPPMAYTASMATPKRVRAWRIGQECNRCRFTLFELPTVLWRSEN